MARNAKTDEAPKSITKADLLGVIKEASRQKQLAAEYSGNHGKVVSGAVDRYGIEKNAFTYTRRLHDMEEGKRMSVIRANLEYWDKCGFFDQLDAFDDVLDVLRAIVERADGEQTERAAEQPAADGVMDDLVDGTTTH